VPAASAEAKPGKRLPAATIRALKELEAGEVDHDADEAPEPPPALILEATSEYERRLKRMEKRDKPPEKLHAGILFRRTDGPGGLVRSTPASHHVERVRVEGRLGVVRGVRNG
jgi:hypothetical protein